MWPFKLAYLYTIIWLANIHLLCSYNSRKIKLKRKLTVLTLGCPRQESSFESPFILFHTKSSSFIFLFSTWDRLTLGEFIAKDFIMYLNTMPGLRTHVLTMYRVAIEFSMSIGNCPMVLLSVCDSVYGITNILDF